MGTAAFFNTVKTCRKDSGVVNYKAVTFTKMACDVKKVFMADVAGLPVEDHKS